MALGWGLWEGPARFIFGADSYPELNWPLYTDSALTLERSGIIYGTENELRLAKTEMKQQGHR